MTSVAMHCQLSHPVEGVARLVLDAQAGACVGLRPAGKRRLRGLPLEQSRVLGVRGTRAPARCRYKGSNHAGNFAKCATTPGIAEHVSLGAGV